MKNESMPHWLSKQAMLAPDQIAIETKEKNLTFLELKRASEQFAKRLSSLGIKKNSRIAILSDNRLEMVIAIHAASYLQAVLVLLNIRLTTKELVYQLSKAKADVIITTDKLREEKKLPHTQMMTYEETMDLPLHEEAMLATHIHLDNPYTMMFTSGTTGLPKAVLHTYGNHWWSAIASALNLGLEARDKWLLTLPMFHISGFSILMKSIIYGMPVHLLDKYDAGHLCEALQKKSVTLVSLVTVMLRQALDYFGDDDFPPNIRSILLGGGAVPEALYEKVNEKRVPLIQSYGLTETTSQVATLSAADAAKKSGSSGKPLFPAEIKIASPDKEGVGEIWVKGPMVMGGYLNDEKANEKAYEDGWFKTGDLGFIDSEDFLYVVDRRSDLIISGGENIYPTEIENVILELNEAKEAAVVGQKDDVWGEVPVAFVVAEPTLSEIELKQHMSERIASYKQPKEIFFVESLPRNASNKIMRHQLKKYLEQ